MGSWEIYRRQERDDPGHLNAIVAGPWFHGGWSRAGDMLGPIPIGTASGQQFQDEIQAPFFRYWLHGQGTRPDLEVRSLQSGSWRWRSYAHWPPAGATMRQLYLHGDGSLSFDAPAAGEPCRSYVSDPASPVPFRQRPMSATYATPDWRTWEMADQRFLQGRPDVLSWTSAPLTADLTVTGDVAATLMAATSGTDGDFVVKLIDVYPDDAVPPPGTSAAVGDYARSLDGYQLPIAMEVRRGRFLDSDTTPHPLVPDQVRAWDVPLRPHDHVFRAGHRIMVQVQSSWFPVIDRNPQTFTPNIATAPPEAFRAATQRVCPGSRVSLPVMGG